MYVYPALFSTYDASRTYSLRNDNYFLIYIIPILLSSSTFNMRRNTRRYISIKRSWFFVLSYCDIKCKINIYQF